MKPSKDWLKTRKALLRMAWRATDSEINPFASHPLVRAFLMAGGTLSLLAGETEIPKDSLKRFSQSGGNYNLTDETLFELFVQAMGQIRRREEELAQQFKGKNELTDAERESLFNLNEAHRLTYGQTLLHYYQRQQEGGQ